MTHLPTRLAAAALTLALAVPAHAAAQGSSDGADGLSVLKKGRRSLEFNLADVFGGFGDQGRFGYWSMRSDRTALGLFANVAFSRSDTDRTQDEVETDRTSFAVSLGPSLKRYVRTVGPVAPYIRGDLAAGIQRTSDDFVSPQATAESTSTAFIASAGFLLGAEWFPLEGISVGGHTGLVLDFVHDSQEQTVSGPVSDLIETDFSRISVSTVTTGLLFQIWF
ncbi:MAG: hypothetical protein ABFS34_11460 [Gemmatimonadota bacterium]